MKQVAAMPARALSFHMSGDLPPTADRVEELQDIYAQRICQCEVRPVADSGLHVDVKLHGVGGLGIGYVTFSNGGIHREARHLTDDDLVFYIMLAGKRRLVQHKRDVILHPGEAVLMSSSDISNTTLNDAQFIALRIKRKQLGARLASVDDSVARGTHRDSEPVRLLQSYARMLSELSSGVTPDFPAIAATHVYDLVGLALGATGDQAHEARLRGGRAARLHEIKTDIVSNIEYGDLPIAEIAARHRLPVRYIQRLFEEDRTTFTEYVLEQRLAHAHRTLANPRLSHQKINTIAASAGFNNLSHFNQRFRQRYGATPGEVRASHQFRLDEE